ncbi:hypothetical protein F4604DRAFT_1581137, partial [Suillus subluteus]
DWTDNIARDIANILVNYMTEEVGTFAFTYHVFISESRQKNGFPSRILVVAGHSFGGCLAHAFQLVIIHGFSGLVFFQILIMTLASEY